MPYKILCDRRLIRLDDERYLLMLQTADSDKRTLINNRAILDKRWSVFRGDGDKFFLTRGELEYQVFKYIVSVTNEDGSVNVAKSREQNFESPNELRRFFTTGMKNYASIGQYREAGNKLGVCFTEDDGAVAVFEVENERDLSERLRQFQSEGRENLDLCFLNRNLYSMHLNYGNVSFEQEEVEHWYAVTTELDEQKLYYKRKSHKRLLFTENLNAAKVFMTREEAQDCIDGFPALTDEVEFAIEEQDVPVFTQRRVYQKETKSEME